MNLDNDPEFHEELKKLFEEIKNFNPTGDNEALESLQNEMGFNMNDFEDFLANGLTKKIISYKKLSVDTMTPQYAYNMDSGFDLYSTEDMVLPPFGRALVPTGIRFDIGEGFEIQVRSKSGLALKQGLMVLNSPGTVDEGYTGEVQVIIFNTNKEPFQITKGMKVAQAVLSKCFSGRVVNLVKVDKINDKDRGDNGFGSTGI